MPSAPSWSCGPTGRRLPPPGSGQLGAGVPGAGISSAEVDTGGGLAPEAVSVGQAASARLH
jgi:hypothetical protein